MGGNPRIPGGEYHPVLVVGRSIDVVSRTATLRVAYGTGSTKESTRGNLDLIITDKEYAAHGLEKPTRFDLAEVNKLELEWAEEWFSKPRSKPAMVIGSLQPDSLKRYRDLRDWRIANGRND